MIIFEIMEVIINLFMFGAGLFLIMCSIIGFIFIYDKIERKIKNNEYS